MNRASLSDSFVSVAAKRLTVTEVSYDRSNQHDFDLSTSSMGIICTAPASFSTRFIYLGKDADHTITADGMTTCFDARKNSQSRSECRLRFHSTPVLGAAIEGDLLIITVQPQRRFLVIIVAQGATYESQLLWLFGLSSVVSTSFSVQEIRGDKNRSIGFSERLILTELGVEASETDGNYLQRMLDQFGEKFPNTRTFSKFARSTLPEVSAKGDPDSAIVAWMNHEGILFKTMEKHIAAQKLTRGFGEDIDAFLEFSRTLYNQRKSWPDCALKNHIEYAMKENGILFSMHCETENKAKPDFLFPAIEYYNQSQFPIANLTMLGVKSTCKDRWRQVLAEASRIKDKHLLTLEPGISRNQTEEMRANHLQLVVPSGMHETYDAEQREWLMDVSDFLLLVKERQEGIQKLS